MSSRALGWAMQTRRTQDPVERLVLIYLGDGADQNDEAVWPFTGLFPPEGDVLPTWTGLDVEGLHAVISALIGRGIVSAREVGVPARADQQSITIAKLDVYGDEP